MYICICVYIYIHSYFFNKHWNKIYAVHLVVMAQYTVLIGNLFYKFKAPTVCFVSFVLVLLSSYVA